MNLTEEAAEQIGILKRPLLELTPGEITRIIEDGSILKKSDFSPKIAKDLAYFYAPFDWVNGTADIVLVGITPGQHQAKQALLKLRERLASGSSVAQAAAEAKQIASFDGDMRDIAARLMDRFNMHRLFGLSSCKELFGSASLRVHYTSILRYPVQQQKSDGAWKNYGGAPDLLQIPLLKQLFEEKFVPEIKQFRNAWIVPFGPVPAIALEQLGKRGIIRFDRVLAGMNHPSGTQWNRHNCQLNTTANHSTCAKNVGCKGLQERSNTLYQRVTQAWQLEVGS